MQIPCLICPKTLAYGPAHRVNIVKKFAVEGGWNVFPAVVETNGKLKDKVRVRGPVEVRPEGSHCVHRQRKAAAPRDIFMRRVDELALRWSILGIVRTGWSTKKSLPFSDYCCVAC
jgi:hypothetical protein